MKLNIGSGYKSYPGFINIDKDVKADHQLDLEIHTLPFDDNSVEEVKAYHILEHLGQGYFHCLKELYRVCEEGAIIDIVVPHHNHDNFHSDPTHKRAITQDGLKLFSKKYNNFSIELGLADSTLGLIYDVDFEIVKVKFIPDKFYEKIIQENTEEQNIRLFREANNVISETHITLIVIK